MPEIASNEANFGVGGEARLVVFPELVERGGELRWGELTCRREKYAGRLARLRLFLYLEVTVSLSCSEGFSWKGTSLMESASSSAEE
jgi:hypothetical protein